MQTATSTPTFDSMAMRVATHPFFIGMNRQQLALLADCAMPAHFDKGEVIIREGEPANCFYLLTSGKVALECNTEFGGRLVIEAIGAGDLLGWSWMMPPYHWHFTARAIEPSDGIVFASTILRQYCERDHSLGFELHKRMSSVMMKRLQSAHRKMVEINAVGGTAEMANNQGTPQPAVYLS